MEISKALSQISEIHEHLVKGEIYRDYRAGPVALGGGLALLAAALQTPLIGRQPDIHWVLYWTAAGALCALVSSIGVVHGYLKRRSAAARRHTRTVVGQLLPCLAAGAVVTAALAVAGEGAIRWLPGLWAIFFSQGIFASRPYLPRIIGWVALYYLAAGGVLMVLTATGGPFSPWGTGLTFGIGQLLAGLVLYWDLER